MGPIRRTLQHEIDAVAHVVIRAILVAEAGSKRLPAARIDLKTLEIGLGGRNHLDFGCGVHKVRRVRCLGRLVPIWFAAGMLQFEYFAEVI